jgi:DNA helicase-2/ATP-dependent DNA helicase PcrA
MLNGLNQAQMDAVYHQGGHALVVAGAGSGKTRVLTYRVAYLLDQGINPHNIMLLTFTNKAGNEMKDRVVELVGDNGDDIMAGTFHSVCARLLRPNAELLGFDENFTIADRNDQMKMMRSLISDLGYKNRVDPGDVVSQISYLKSNMVTPSEYEAEMNDSDFPAVRLYYEYEELLHYENKMDFGDLIKKTAEMISRDLDLKANLHSRYRFLLVDEYQDTNKAQYAFLREITGPQTEVFVVGDSDQAIYSFRGADVSNILSFADDYNNSKVYRLEQNYRSTGTILHAANTLIEQNPERQPKKLWTESASGEPISLIECDDPKHEAWHITEEIKHLVRSGQYEYKDIAILYRLNHLAGSVEKEFLKKDIPYEMVKGLDFFERKEVKDIIAYLKVIANPKDNTSLRRIINTPSRGIGEKTLEKLESYGIEEDVGLMGSVFSYNLVGALSSRAKNAVKGFVDLLKELNKEETVVETIEKIMEITEYDKQLDNEALDRIDQLKEVAGDYEKETPDSSILGFLQNMSLVSDIDEYEDDENSVKMMTVHTAKGLEFPVVFGIGMEQGIFPHDRSINEGNLEEERRLAYVAITRAEEKLYLSYTRRRIIYGNHVFRSPSQFLREVDPGVFKEEDYYESAVAQGA